MFGNPRLAKCARASMLTMRAFVFDAVTYDGLPISSGGAHGLGRLRGRSAYQAFKSFLDACSHHRSLSSEFWLDGDEGPEVRERLEAHFPASEDRRFLPAPEDRVLEAIDLYDDLDVRPDRWGLTPVWFTARAVFTLRQPHSHDPWPDQGRDRFNGFEVPGGITLGESVAYLTMSPKARMALQLCLPGATDRQVADTIPWLQANLPFRLSTKHWLRWTLTKSGTSYRPRRITPEGLS